MLDGFANACLRNSAGALTRPGYTVTRDLDFVLELMSTHTERGTRLSEEKLRLAQRKKALSDELSTLALELSTLGTLCCALCFVLCVLCFAPSCAVCATLCCAPDSCVPSYTRSLVVLLCVH